MDGLFWETLLTWMIWGYPYFRKHPYHFSGNPSKFSSIVFGCMLGIPPKKGNLMIHVIGGMMFFFSFKFLWGGSGYDDKSQWNASFISFLEHSVAIGRLILFHSKGWTDWTSNQELLENDYWRFRFLQNHDLKRSKYDIQQTYAKKNHLQ